MRWGLQVTPGQSVCRRPAQAKDPAGVHRGVLLPRHALRQHPGTGARPREAAVPLPSLAARADRGQGAPAARPSRPRPPCPGRSAPRAALTFLRSGQATARPCRAVASRRREPCSSSSSRNSSSSSGRHSPPGRTIPAACGPRPPAVSILSPPPSLLPHLPF